MGPDNEFICLIPPSHNTPIQPQENIDQDAVLRNGWSLLEPLSGKCLYVRYLSCYGSDMLFKYLL
jgi:protein OS-9